MSRRAFASELPLSGAAERADPSPTTAADVWDQVEHHWAENGDVMIHYVTLGQGEPILFISRFSRHLVLVATSDGHARSRLQGRSHGPARLQPERSAQGHRELTRWSHILGDVSGGAIDDLGGSKITLVGPTTGAAGIAWRYAMEHPEKIERPDHF